MDNVTLNINAISCTVNNKIEDTSIQFLGVGVKTKYQVNGVFDDKKNKNITVYYELQILDANDKVVRSDRGQYFDSRPTVYDALYADFVFGGISNGDSQYLRALSGMIERIPEFVDVEVFDWGNNGAIKAEYLP